MSRRDFAEPVVVAIKALSSKKRRRILIELEDSPLSYSEILKRTKMRKGTLNYHLKKLVASGLVRNFLREEEPHTFRESLSVSQKYPREEALHMSYYEVSELGRRLIEGILDAFRPIPWYVAAQSSTTASSKSKLRSYTKIDEFLYLKALSQSPASRLSMKDFHQLLINFLYITYIMEVNRSFPKLSSSPLFDFIVNSVTFGKLKPKETLVETASSATS